MKRVAITVLVLGVLVVVLLVWAMFGDRSSFRTGLNSYEGLPQTASDITVYQNANISGFFLTDFRISEPDFISFAREKHWSIQPISVSASISTAKAFQEGHLNNMKEVRDGLYYSQHANNGSGVTVAYDRKDGRAYIASSRR